MARGPALQYEFYAGYKGWLDSTSKTLLSFEVDDAAHAAVLRAGRNGFLVLLGRRGASLALVLGIAVIGWMSSLGMYHYYLLWLIGIIMEPFDKKFFIFSVIFSAYKHLMSCTTFDDQTDGYVTSCFW